MGRPFFRLTYAGWLNLVVKLRRAGLASLADADELPVQYLLDLLSAHHDLTQR